ncbi:MAG: GntR family transcriptional regulator [Clostridia bacterium]|jgi:GntR family transcriptional regulator|nr:GntR family transcriptional regulator [Clostridia bacterium]
MLIELDFNSQKPIYEQLYEQIILSIAKGTLKEGESLPAVRTLAEEIGINLHTVNKTYNLLKDEGYLSIDRRKGAIVNSLPITLKTEYEKELFAHLELLVAKAYLLGLKQDYFTNICRQYFEHFKEDLK